MSIVVEAFAVRAMPASPDPAAESSRCGDVPLRPDASDSPRDECWTPLLSDIDASGLLSDALRMEAPRGNRWMIGAAFLEMAGGFGAAGGVIAATVLMAGEAGGRLLFRSGAAEAAWAGPASNRLSRFVPDTPPASAPLRSIGAGECRSECAVCCAAIGRRTSARSVVR
jgi:hypothetical protein